MTISARTIFVNSYRTARVSKRPVQLGNGAVVARGVCQRLPAWNAEDCNRTFHDAFNMIARRMPAARRIGLAYMTSRRKVDGSRLPA